LVKDTHRNELLINSIKNWVNKITRELKPETSKNVKLDERLMSVC